MLSSLSKSMLFPHVNLHWPLLLLIAAAAPAWAYKKNLLIWSKLTLLSMMICLCDFPPSTPYTLEPISVLNNAHVHPLSLTASLYPPLPLSQIILDSPLLLIILLHPSLFSLAVTGDLAPLTAHLVAGYLTSLFDLISVVWDLAPDPFCSSAVSKLSLTLWVVSVLMVI